MIQVETAIPSFFKDGARFNVNIRNGVSSETYTFLYFKKVQRAILRDRFFVSHNKKDISPRLHIY